MREFGFRSAETRDQFRAAMYVVFTIQSAHLCIDDSEGEVEAVSYSLVGQTFQ